MMWRLLAAGAGLVIAAHGFADGDVTAAARAYLAGRYTAEVEHGYCVTKWHKGRDAAGRVIPVIDEVAEAADQHENSELGVQFDCGALPTLHTHPPRFPTPSTADIAKGIVHDELPFIVIQSGRDSFNFWVVADRL